MSFTFLRKWSPSMLIVPFILIASGCGSSTPTTLPVVSETPTPVQAQEPVIPPTASSGTSASLETPAPVPVPDTSDNAPTGAATYTLAQVAKHPNTSSCWTTINGDVYDVTRWIKQHPGGSDAILSLCGKDGSNAFNQQHGGQRRPASELAEFKIGTLAK